MLFLTIALLSNLAICVGFTSTFHYKTHVSTMFSHWVQSVSPYARGVEKSLSVGGQGEYYFHPAVRFSIKDDMPHKLIVVPIIPHSHPFGPYSKYPMIFQDFESRKILDSVGKGGYIGTSFYSQSENRLALVGSLMHVDSIEFNEDGKFVGHCESYGRYFIKKVIQERPHLVAKVQLFSDTCENIPESVEIQKMLFDRMTLLLKLSRGLKPLNVDPLVSRYRPMKSYNGEHLPYILPIEDKIGVLAMSKFSFGCLEMLGLPPPLVLKLMQELTLAKRMASLMSITNSSISYLLEQLSRKEIPVIEDDVEDLWGEPRHDYSPNRNIGIPSYI